MIIVNSKDESEQKQLLINSLEDKDNKYRAVFAVDKLNEGWDVLNLFDIVRLYTTQKSNARKPSNTTMSEAQLIGRGARYWPYQIDINQPIDKRKYDHEVDNELRVCETLYYHTPTNPTYIQELDYALEKIGIKKTGDEEKEAAFETSKEDQQILINSLKEFLVEQNGSATINIQWISNNQENNKIIFKTIELILFGSVKIRSAINKLPFYYFSNLSCIFPQLKSISEFINSPLYLGKIEIQLESNNQLKDLLPTDKLKIAIKALIKIQEIITASKRTT